MCLGLRCPSSSRGLGLTLRAFLSLWSTAWCPGRHSASPLLGRWVGFSGKLLEVRCQGLTFHGDGVVTTSALPKVVCYVNMNLMDASVQPLALGLLENAP